MIKGIRISPALYSKIATLYDVGEFSSLKELVCHALQVYMRDQLKYELDLFTPFHKRKAPTFIGTTIFIAWTPEQLDGLNEACRVAGYRDQSKLIRHALEYLVSCYSETA